MTLYTGWARNYVVPYDANYEGARDFTADSANGRTATSLTPDPRYGVVFAG